MNRHAINFSYIANAARERVLSLSMKPGVAFGVLKVEGGLSS